MPVSIAAWLYLFPGARDPNTDQVIYSDALAIHDEIMEVHESISIMGRSSGSAVATYFGSKRPIKNLVLIISFDSVQSIAQPQCPIYLMGFLLKDNHDSHSRTKDIPVKTLVIAAELDRVVKMPHTKRRLEGFEPNVVFYVLNGVGHNNIAGISSYYKFLHELFIEWPPKQQGGKRCLMSAKVYIR